MDQYVLDRYASLMGDVGRRLETIKSLLERKTTTLFVQTNTETMCLQLRMTLEIIAFANLVANQRAYEQVRNDISSDWHADRILRTIERVNADFYPRPVRAVTTRGFRFKRSGFLTRAQFAELYDTCGGLLHTGSPFKPPLNYVRFRRTIGRWVARIESLLAEHLVTIVGAENSQLWVIVPLDDTDQARVAWLEPVPVVKRSSAKPLR